MCLGKDSQQSKTLTIPPHLKEDGVSLSNLMKRIIAKEIAPKQVDFSPFFKNSNFSTNSMEDIRAIYILNGEGDHGFNIKQYKDIIRKANDTIEECHSKIGKDINYNLDPEKTIQHTKLMQWALKADIYDPSDIVEYLTITTGSKWRIGTFIGTDNEKRGCIELDRENYCQVIYCENSHEYETINKIGKLWVGHGTEFKIEGERGYFVEGCIREREDFELVQLLANYAGCSTENIDVYLHEYVKVDNFKLLNLSK